MPVQLQEKAKLEDPNVAPSPYSEEQGSTGLYPVISGTMNFEGAFDTKQMTTEDWEQRELEKKQGVEEETRKTEEELDELSRRRKQLQDEVNVIDLLEWAKKGMEKEKEREEEGKNDRRKDEGKTSPDPCEGESEASQGKIEGKRCQAHKKGTDNITQGNTKADKAAKEASGYIEATIAPEEIARPHPGPGVGNIEPQITLEDGAQLQEAAPVAEKTMWRERGALQGQHDKIWRNGEGLIIAPTSLLTVLISEAHGVDHCARGEVARKIKKEGFWSPYLQNSIDYILGLCEVCAQNNIRKGITAPIGHEPRREGPFEVTRVSPTALQVEGSTLWYHLNHCTRTVPGVGERRETEVRGRVDRSSSEEEIALHEDNREGEEQSQSTAEIINDDESGSVHELADDTNAQLQPVSHGAEGGEDGERASFPTGDLEPVSLGDFLDP
ncbi:uncharacterized protein LOC119960679 [Scyliorhinus canicula]|uniref:uncharacterized protein LOC119960679 n=1 Tax=Scyliorhinus canicula TaxID=7830 RepID=UPI0018F4AA40|nr:uncharacterized protein LOC119960679 [Scyliorhinus canicula]